MKFLFMNDCSPSTRTKKKSPQKFPAELQNTTSGCSMKIISSSSLLLSRFPRTLTRFGRLAGLAARSPPAISLRVGFFLRGLFRRFRTLLRRRNEDLIDHVNDPIARKNIFRNHLRTIDFNGSIAPFWNSDVNVLSVKSGNVSSSQRENGTVNVSGYDVIEEEGY
mmetsp:Transcript_21917/g.44594  ORF Transcript_21917/g.44594 Transcript_21917/m.44594 type:complete len:165 (+) Transcript_21917:48-542(+)